MMTPPLLAARGGSGCIQVVTSVCGAPLARTEGLHDKPEEPH